MPLPAVYFDASQLCVEYIRQDHRMGGMARVVRAWARNMANRQEFHLVSGLPESLVAEAEKFSHKDGIENILAPADKTWASFLSSSIRRSGKDRKLFSKLNGFVSFRLAMKSASFGITDILESQGHHEPFIYHYPYYPVRFPHRLPAHCIPVINIFDVIPFVFTDTYSGSDRREFQKTIDSLGKLNGRIIVNSRDTKHSLICRFDFDRERIHVVPLGADCIQSDLISNPTTESEDRPYFLYVASSGQRRKNVEGAIAGFKSFVDQSAVEADIIVVGSGTSAHQPFADRMLLGTSGRARCLDHVTEEELGNLYKGASIGLYLSLYEGFGLPIVEYMQRGIPVVCGNSTSLPEVAGNAALIVDPLQPEAIADAITRILRNPLLRQGLVERGKSRALELSWERSCQALSNCYLEILRQR